VHSLSAGLMPYMKSFERKFVSECMETCLGCRCAAMTAVRPLLLLKVVWFRTAR
jgi:hypothetical protein